MGILTKPQQQQIKKKLRIEKAITYTTTATTTTPFFSQHQPTTLHNQASPPWTQMTVSLVIAVLHHNHNSSRLQTSPHPQVFKLHLCPAKDMAPTGMGLHQLKSLRRHPMCPKRIIEEREEV